MAAWHQDRGPVSPVSSGVSKVPAVSLYFWALKLLTTAMGEAMSDYTVEVNKYLAVLVGFAVFIAAITWQLRTPRYGTWPYWTAVSMVAVFGTMAADVMHVALGIPYLVSASFCAICLIVTFIAWYRSEGTLNIHSIVTPRREVFYWLTVVFTFAMGTALGDLFATTFTLGYLTSAFVFIGLILIPLAAWRLGANPVLTFWVAYIITRPIGASFADFFGQPKDISGMGYGHGIVAIVTLIMVVAFIIYLTRSGIDQPEAAPSAASAAAPAGYGNPRHAQPRYAQPQQGQPQYGGSRYGQPQYGDPQRGQYGQPPYGDPRQGQPEHTDPRYAAPRQGDPRYATDPRHPSQRYGQPQYGASPDEAARYGDPWQPRREYQDPRYADRPEN